MEYFIISESMLTNPITTDDVVSSLQGLLNARCSCLHLWDQVANLCSLCFGQINECWGRFWKVMILNNRGESKKYWVFIRIEVP